MNYSFRSRKGVGILAGRSHSRGFTATEIVVVLVCLALLAVWAGGRLDGGCRYCGSPEAFASRRAHYLDQVTSAFKTHGGTIVGTPAKPMTVARANEIVRQVNTPAPGRPSFNVAEFPAGTTFPSGWGEKAPGEFTY